MIDYSEALQREGLTVTVRSMHAQGDGAEVALRILLESGEHREERRLVLTVEQYYELKPTRGEISEELYERLEEAATLSRAVHAGESLLSYGGNTLQMLTQKLMRRGFSRAVAASAAERLQAMGLIDERRDLIRELEKCLRKLWGPKRISAQLWSRGFGVEAMKELPALLERVDFVSACAELIRKHYGEVPADSAEQKRMIAALGRYGYSIHEIRDAMRIVGSSH